jgi:hypothetical protein
MKLSAILLPLLPLAATAKFIRHKWQIGQDGKWHEGWVPRSLDTTHDDWIIKCNRMLPPHTTREVRMELCVQMGERIAPREEKLDEELNGGSSVMEAE